MNQIESKNTRSLKIERTGDFWKITPRIRLNGKWLERAGFKPGHRVDVILDQPGVMTLRAVAQTSEGTL